MTLADLDLDPLLAAILAERRDLVAAWLHGEPGSWGALAARAILATRRALGRSLTDTERRIVWQALWDHLVTLRQDEAASIADDPQP